MSFRVKTDLVGVMIPLFTLCVVSGKLLYISEMVIIITSLQGVCKGAYLVHCGLSIKVLMVLL